MRFVYEYECSVKQSPPVNHFPTHTHILSLAHATTVSKPPDLDETVDCTCCPYSRQPCPLWQGVLFAGNWWWYMNSIISIAMSQKWKCLV